MNMESENHYTTRCAFQHDLDRTFPEGVVCALLPIQNHRVRTLGGRVASIGRIFCSDVRPGLGDGWDYEVLVDLRKATDESDAKIIRLWISELTAHATEQGLWEAKATSEGREMVLRLSPTPADSTGPMGALRDALTEAHESELFPQGLQL